MAIIWPYPSSPSSYATAGQQVAVPPQRCPSCLWWLIGWGGYWRWLRAPLLVERIWIRRGTVFGVSPIARAAARPGARPTPGCSGGDWRERGPQADEWAGAAANRRATRCAAHHGAVVVAPLPSTVTNVTGRVHRTGRNPGRGQRQR